VDVVTFRLTGKSALAAIVALAIAYIEITAWQFSRECAQLDRVKSDLEFWLRAGEMRNVVACDHAAVDSGEKRDERHSLRDRHHVVGPRTCHLEVDLAELGLAIRAQVLVAKASRDLVVAVEAADHQELL
jgi:hypothetical protein